MAQVLNVTNQAVSKWESGSNCPDISLLPEIAAYFNVSIDELLGYKPADNFADIFLKIKNLFQEMPAEEHFDLSYKLAFLSCAQGYIHNSWVINEEINKREDTPGDFYKWGYSMLNDPKGQTVMKGRSVFISKNDSEIPVEGNIREIYNAIQPFSDKDNLRVLYALYESTLKDLYVPVEEIAAKAKLTIDTVEKALDVLPVQPKNLEDGSLGYQITDMYIPALLTLFTDK